MNGCPEFAVNVSPGVTQCMTGAQYEQWRIGQEEQTFDDNLTIVISALIFAIVFLAILLLILVKRRRDKRTYLLKKRFSKIVEEKMWFPAPGRHPTPPHRPPIKTTGLVRVEPPAGFKITNSMPSSPPPPLAPIHRSHETVPGVPPVEVYDVDKFGPIPDDKP